MNRKGFTLVEVIVVIAILAVLLLILVPNVFVLLEKNNTKSCENLKKNIESSAKMYVTNNKYNLNIKCFDANNSDSTTLEIKFQTLIDSGDLTPNTTGKITNPIDDKEILLDKSIIKVTYDCNTKEFNYDIEMYDIDNELVDCTNN